MIAIYKGDDPTNPSNYRPISLLRVSIKLQEKLMYNRLDPFFQKHEVFYKYQFGFRKNHATDNGLTEVMNYIYRSLNEGNYVFGVYIDLKKAFDIYYLLTGCKGRTRKYKLARAVWKTKGLYFLARYEHPVSK